MDLVLASESPRRKELLSRLGVYFESIAPRVDETVLPGEMPTCYVERLARHKAQTISRSHPSKWVLAADTAVVHRGNILGKPNSSTDARNMLHALSGDTHQVLTGVALAGSIEAVRVVETRVSFRPISEAEIAWYVQTGEPLDKAGAYALQGIGACFIVRIEGSPTNVIGLPLVETLGLLQQTDILLPWQVTQ